MPENKKTGQSAKVIGVLGGIASGKSQVAQFLLELGAQVLDADKVGHQVLKQPEVIDQVCSRFGDSVIDANQQVDRSELAKIVFGADSTAQQALIDLEKITHPRIGDKLKERIEHISLNDQPPAFVLDAPVMIKAGWHKLCDYIVYVDAAYEDRIARAQTRGWSQEDYDAREASQEKLEVKRTLADYVINNRGTLADLKAQTTQFWAEHIASSSF